MSAVIRLLSFKYLRRRRILVLTLIIVLSSTLFSLTALSLLSFYRGFTAYLGEEENVVVIYDLKSRTPYTGLVPAYLTNKLATTDGVLAVSPEVIAPCLVNDQAVFLRGIIPESLVRLNPLRIIEGNPLDISDSRSAIIGRNIAEKLRLKPNQRLLLLGVLADRYVELDVKGVFISNSAMDDEILAPLYIGQWLRGSDYNSVTFIRLKIDKDVITPSEIFDVIASEALQLSRPSPSVEQPKPMKPPTQWMTRHFSIEKIGVKETFEFMKSYMDRYGITKEALLVLSTTTFLFSSLTIILSSKTLINQHKGEINVLRSLGASKRLLKIDIIIKLLPWIIIASMTGMLIASATLSIIQGYGYLQVLSHTAPSQLDPLVAVLNLIFSVALVSIGVLRDKLE